MAFVLSSSLLTHSNFIAQADQESNTGIIQVPEKEIQLTANTEGKLQTVTIPDSELLFKLTPKFDSNGNLINFAITLKPELADLYKQIGPRPDLKAVFVYPIFTQAAYGKNGFYDYYHGKCDTSCLTVNIPQPVGYYSASGDGSVALNLLGYPFITDIEIDKNPDILKQYDRVIVLHNEYVTQKEFDAITSHPDVIFLYPNALYAKVTADYTANTITLIRGHGYPDSNIRNGFDWQYDNSKYEYNVFCDNWNFYEKGRYTFVNCYPDYRVLYDLGFLKSLRYNIPSNLPNDLSDWLRYPSDLSTTKILLSDYDINATYVPFWIQNPALMFLNGQISSDDIDNLINYLYEQKIIH